MKSALDKVAEASERYDQALRNKELLEHQKTILSDEQLKEIGKLIDIKSSIKSEIEAAKNQMAASALRQVDAKEEQRSLIDESIKLEDRIESIKAFLVAFLGAAVASVPILMVNDYSFEADCLTMASTVLLSGLFGITYRYATGDGKNIQLKTGVIGAFWIACSLSAAQSTWNTLSNPITQFDYHLWIKIGLQAFQTVVILLASTLALELSFRSGKLKHPTQKT